MPKASNQPFFFSDKNGAYFILERKRNDVSVLASYDHWDWRLKGPYYIDMDLFRIKFMLFYVCCLWCFFRSCPIWIHKLFLSRVRPWYFGCYVETALMGIVRINWYGFHITPKTLWAVYSRKIRELNKLQKRPFCWI